MKVSYFERKSRSLTRKSKRMGFYLKTTLALYAFFKWFCISHYLIILSRWLLTQCAIHNRRVEQFNRENRRAQMRSRGR